MSLLTSTTRRILLIAASVREDGTGFARVWWRARKVRGWLGATDAKNLYNLARVGPGEGAIVEIGSAWGRSTAFLACGSRRAGREKILAIDPHTGDVFDPNHTEGFSSLGEFTANMRMMGVTDYVIPIVATSEAAASSDVGPIRLLFIDGMHTYAAVKLDIELWEPRVIQGGIVVFDDYLFDEVGRAIDEYVALGTTRRIPGNGIHVVYQKM